MLRFRINYSEFKKGGKIVIKKLAYRGELPPENVNNNNNNKDDITKNSYVNRPNHMHHVIIS